MRVVGLMVLFALWVFGARTSAATQSLAFTLWDLVGAGAMWVLSSRYPKVVQQAVRALALGWLVIALGDAILTLELFTHAPEGSLIQAVRVGVHLLGGAVVLVGGTLLPWAMERQGLYPPKASWRYVTLALLGAALLSAVLVLARNVSLLDLVLQMVTFYLAFLFGQQVFALSGGRLSEGLQNVFGALLLISIGRVINELVGLSRVATILSDLCWIAGATLLVYALRRRHHGLA